MTVKGQKHGTYTIVLGKPLSPRENKAMFYTALGLTTEQTGEKMAIAPGTARRHRQNSYVKLGVFAGAVEAVALLLVTDKQFYDEVKDAMLEGIDKPDKSKRENNRAQN